MRVGYASARSRIAVSTVRYPAACASAALAGCACEVADISPWQAWPALRFGFCAGSIRTGSEAHDHAAIGPVQERIYPTDLRLHSRIPLLRFVENRGIHERNKPLPTLSCFWVRRVFERAGRGRGVIGFYGCARQATPGASPAFATGVATTAARDPATPCYPCARHS